MKFIKLTDLTDNGIMFFNVLQIIYIEKSVSEGTVIATNYMGLIYVKETPEEILQKIKEAESE